MKIADIKKNAFAMPFTSPSGLKIDYKFKNREYLIITYESDIEALQEVVPEPLKVVSNIVKFEFDYVLTRNNSFEFKNIDETSNSPLAKKLAAEKGINISAVAGSGENGRIVKSDVLGAKGTQPKVATPHSLGRIGEEYTVKPLSQMRKVIAKRLLESKQNIPHFYLGVDCILDNLLAIREEMNAKAPKAGDAPLYKLSVNDFVIKASAHALKAVPEANASWSDNGLLQYNNIDISVAVAIDDGLITPIVKNADQKSLSAISNEMKDLIKRAKSNSLKADEFQGGGFSISNLGMYGIKEFNAIINPPQACIMAVGAAEKRPIVEDDEIEIATVMNITLSCDHRVVDGAVGARFLQAFKAYIENPAMMLA